MRKSLAAAAGDLAVASMAFASATPASARTVIAIGIGVPAYPAYSVVRRCLACAGGVNAIEAAPLKRGSYVLKRNDADL